MARMFSPGVPGDAPPPAAEGLQHRGVLGPVDQIPRFPGIRFQIEEDLRQVGAVELGLQIVPLDHQIESALANDGFPHPGLPLLGQQGAGGLAVRRFQLYGVAEGGEEVGGIDVPGDLFLRDVVRGCSPNILGR